MKKKYLIILPALLLSAFLTACDDEKQTNMNGEMAEDEMEVDASDFYNIIYQNKLNQLITWTDEGVMISGIWLKELPTDTTALDTVLEKEAAEPHARFEKIYENAEITADGLKYYIKLNDDITLEFEKVGPRIIKDSQGFEYYSKKYPGE
ncbi:hypothetical protein [Metasolibacillus meyeri]|uniref:hypothetical protein n=1 Tax=Metasolibacillus meyeri TaxID=1071052 RepID=UPI000D322F73|nr:hypothetical protein [Metasolibacillus meyeri]